MAVEDRDPTAVPIRPARDGRALRATVSLVAVGAVALVGFGLLTGPGLLGSGGDGGRGGAVPGALAQATPPETHALAGTGVRVPGPHADPAAAPPDAVPGLAHCPRRPLRGPLRPTSRSWIRARRRSSPRCRRRSAQPPPPPSGRPSSRIATASSGRCRLRRTSPATTRRAGAARSGRSRTTRVRQGEHGWSRSRRRGPGRVDADRSSPTLGASTASGSSTSSRHPARSRRRRGGRRHSLGRHDHRRCTVATANRWTGMAFASEQINAPPCSSDSRGSCGSGGSGTRPRRAPAG